MASKVWPSWSFAKTFFIYDHDIVQREEDDPKLAVVFFHPHPPHVSEDMQCLFSGQVMAMVSFMSTLAGCKPRLYRLKRMKIATIHAGRFTMAMASSINTPDEIAIQKLENLFGLFNFFNGSIKRIFKEHDSDHDSFVNQVGTIMPSYLSFVHYHDNKVRESFQDVPMVQLPKGSHLVYLKASHLLQWLKRRPKLLAGCILYKHKVLCTQLTPQITRYLLVVKSKQHHLPAITLSLEFEPPVGVKILAAFLTENEYSMFRKTPPTGKMKTVPKGEGVSQTDEKEVPENYGKHQRSSVSDSIPRKGIGGNRPARKDEEVKHLQFTFENNDLQDDGSSKTPHDKKNQDATRPDCQGTGHSKGGREKELGKEKKSETDRLNIICKDEMTGVCGTPQDSHGCGAILGADENNSTEIHASKSERRFDGTLGGVNILNGDLVNRLGEDANCSVGTEDPHENSFTKMHSSEAESSCSERDESDADKERVARRLVWGEEQTEPQNGENRMCNIENGDWTTEEVSQIQKENSGYTESLKNVKDEDLCEGKSLLTEATVNDTKPLTRSGLAKIKDRMENKSDSNSHEVKGRGESQRSQSLLDNSEYESEEDKTRLSTDEGDEIVNISLDEECLYEPEPDRLSDWPPMGQRSISSCSPVSSRRTSVFTEGEKSRSATDDSDNVFDVKVRSTSMISSSKASEEDTLCTQVPDMVGICLYIQVHSEDLVVVFLAEKSLGTDEDSVKKIRQTICSQAAELEEELKAAENTSSKDQSTSPYNYMGYNSFEHSLTTKLEAQIPADDVKFFHGARMLHNEFNKDADLTKVHLGSTNGTVVADQLPGSQEFYFMPSSDTGLSLAKTSSTKTQSKTKVPFGDAWNRR